ncbi:conjugative transposon protein TraM [Bacteroides salyersiae]|nr:conjugative transposon protein TraM [Bacteroides salyersiae]
MSGSTSRLPRWNTTARLSPWSLAVYDTDGQPGIFIPNSMEMNAVREVAANMGGSLGSSINISTNAGAQARLRLGQGADTRHEPVHRQKDANRQGASESRVQGHALPRKILKTIKITTKIQK